MVTSLFSHKCVRLILLSGVVLFAFGIGIAFNAALAFAGEESGVIIVAKGHGDQALRTQEVIINGEHVGTVGNNETKKFSFTPANNGENELYLRDMDGFPQFRGPINSKKYTFKAGDGSKVMLSFERMRGSYVIDMDLTIKEAGAIGGGKNRNNNTVSILGIELGDRVDEREIDSEIIETPPGIEQEYEISRKLERSISFSDSVSHEYSGKLELKVLSTAIGKKMATESEETVNQSETIRRNLKVNGDKTPKTKVVWIAQFKTGTAMFLTNGEKKIIPFSIQVGLKPVITVVE